MRTLLRSKILSNAAFPVPDVPFSSFAEEHGQAQQLSPLTAGLTFDSFAIGGGTPLLLTVPQLEQLMATAALFGLLVAA